MNNKDFNFKEEIKKNPDQFCVEVVTTSGYMDFPTFAEALKYYHDLDMYKNGSNFTWAMNGGYCEDHKKPRMRFEDWKTNELLSQ